MNRSLRSTAAARLRKAKRQHGIVALLSAGVSIPEIAAREGATERHIRQQVQEIRSKRARRVCRALSRLNEALLVAYRAMGGQNLEAVGRVVRIVCELKRYHVGGAPALADPPPPPRRLTKPLALPARHETPEPEASAN